MDAEFTRISIAESTPALAAVCSQGPFSGRLVSPLWGREPRSAHSLRQCAHTCTHMHSSKFALLALLTGLPPVLGFWDTFSQPLSQMPTRPCSSFCRRTVAVGRPRAAPGAARCDHRWRGTACSVDTFAGLQRLRLRARRPRAAAVPSGGAPGALPAPCALRLRR